MSDENKKAPKEDNQKHVNDDSPLDETQVIPQSKIDEPQIDAGEPKIEAKETVATNSPDLQNDVNRDKDLLGWIVASDLRASDGINFGRKEEEQTSGLIVRTQTEVPSDTSTDQLIDSTKTKSSEDKKKRIELSEGDSEENERTMYSWSLYRDRVDKCLTKLKVTDDDKKSKTYEELCKMLTQSTSLYRERKRFYTAKRKSAEAIEEYFQRLTDLASTCSFGERQDLTIADKLINSLGSSSGISSWDEYKEEIGSKIALEVARKDYSDDGFCRLPDFSFSSRHKKKNGKNVDPHMAEIIRKEIMEEVLSVEWDDIAGLDFAKSVINESIVWPLLRPDIFTGLRKLPKGMLLFGPPGNGKTLIAKCIAAQSKSTFFYVSAASLTSKWHGEAEKLVRALFAVAAEHQPSVIFFDEVDSLLTERNKHDHDVSRRMKTEFMIQLDGAATKDEDRVLFIGATNRPQDLDEAVRRRFVKRLYVPLPDHLARQQFLNILLKNESSNLSASDINEIATTTDGFSGADIKWLCQDAAMESLRSISVDRMDDVDLKDIRPLGLSDFVASLKRVRPSVSSNDLAAMIEWDRLYGSNANRADYHDKHFMYL